MGPISVKTSIDAPRERVFEFLCDLANRPAFAERGAGGRLDRIPISTSWELVEGPGSETSEVTLTFVTEPSHPVDRMRERLGAEHFYKRQWSIALSRLKDLIESGRPSERVAVAGGAHLPI
jgi:hypothetical protein